MRGQGRTGRVCLHLRYYAHEIPFSTQPLPEFRSALTALGLRTHEDYDELIHSSADCDLRLNLSRLEAGRLIRCFLSVEEARLLPGGLELFNELALEGHPVVAYGSGRNQITFEFEWLHSERTDWRLAAERVELLIALLSGHLRAKMIRHRFSSGVIEGVLAVTAA